MKKGGGRIRIEEIFEPTIKARAEAFLESGKPIAHLTKALLAVGALGCVIFIGAVAPNLFSAFGRMGGRKAKVSEAGFYKLRKSLYHLKKRRVVEYIGTENEEDVYRFTNKGREIIKKFIFDSPIIFPPKKWDGQMRLIIFDIPNNKKKASDALRRKLQLLDCFPLQKSVWVHPFPCYEEIKYIADVFGVADCVEVVATKDLDNPAVFKHFASLLEKLENH
ncbi:MAG: hypothetical protein AAB527_00335 [Patescibacteria group bacterium]